MTPPGAQFEIKVDGEPCTHRDVRETAIEAARFLQQRLPASKIGAASPGCSAFGERTDNGVYREPHPRRSENSRADSPERLNARQAGSTRSRTCCSTVRRAYSRRR